MTANPVRCFACKGYVDPERLSLSESQVEAIVGWDRVFSSLYRLWLDSREYESWAKAELLRPKGRANIAGMEARASLALSKPTHYWWFFDTDDPEPESCPWCSGVLEAAERHGTKQCNKCAVVL